MDNNPYPHDADLEKIKKWDADFLLLMNFVGDRWHFRDWGWRQKGRTFWISTGGWSGNESLIGAMQANWIFWSLCWYQSRCGGHYIFKVRPIKPGKVKTGGPTHS